MPSRSRLRGAVGKAQEFNLPLVLTIRTLALHSVDLQKHVCMRAHSCRKTRHKPSSYQKYFRNLPTLERSVSGICGRAGRLGMWNFNRGQNPWETVTSPPAASLPPAAEKPSIRQAGSAVA